jgi:enoyl-CoA hydratase
MMQLTKRGRVAILTMAHGKANAMDLEFCADFTARLEECRAPDISALVITGQGRIFSAGVDLLRVVDGGADYVRAFLPALGRVLDALFSFEKPVVAAINGHAIAGGCILACAADRRFIANTATIGCPNSWWACHFRPSRSRFCGLRPLPGTCNRSSTAAPRSPPRRL